MRKRTIVGGAQSSLRRRNSAHNHRPFSRHQNAMLETAQLIKLVARNIKKILKMDGAISF
jgi:hypothetical protein